MKGDYPGHMHVLLASCGTKFAVGCSEPQTRPQGWLWADAASITCHGGFGAALDIALDAQKCKPSNDGEDLEAVVAYSNATSMPAVAEG